jgi:hypothetical protein
LPRIVDECKTRLKRIGYSWVNDVTRTENSRRATMYHVVFASKHELGYEFVGKMAEHRWDDQKWLPLAFS